MFFGAIKVAGYRHPLAGEQQPGIVTGEALVLAVVGGTLEPFAAS